MNAVGTKRTAGIALVAKGTSAYHDGDALFRVDDGIQVMIGWGVRPVGHHGMAGIMGRRRWREMLDGRWRNVAAQVTTIPIRGTFSGQSTS